MDRVYIPGYYLQQELEERNIPPEDFGGMIGVSSEKMAKILTGDERITFELSRRIGKALGHNSLVYIKLQKRYDGLDEDAMVMAKKSFWPEWDEWRILNERYGRVKYEPAATEITGERTDGEP